MHGVLLRPDGTSVCIPLADRDDVTLPNGEVYRGIAIVDQYGQHYWVYLLFHDPTASGLKTTT